MNLAITNAFGNVDLTKTTLTNRYRHIRGKRLQSLCRKLGIMYADAVVGWSGSRRYGYKPVTDGVVVSARAESPLLAAIKARELRNPPEKREVARQHRERCRLKAEKARLERFQKAGIDDPTSRTAHWFERGDIDSYEAQLIQFKASYRHNFTDYETVITRLRAEALEHHGDFRRALLADLRTEARDMCSEQPIPDTWDAYLGTYDFPCPDLAATLARVLKSPRQAHPIWFCEAMLAVKKVNLQPDDLTYEKIRAAVADWRLERACERDVRGDI